MKKLYRVNSKRDIKRLRFSKRFGKYPDMFLGNVCRVIVNKDNYLVEDEFIIKSKYKILPRNIFLYGKKENYGSNNLYLNYWLEIFLKTVEQGYLYKYDLQKSELKTELTIGLPLEFRYQAFDYTNWDRKKVIKFLSCLFDNELIEENYEQQDLFEELVA